MPARARRVASVLAVCACALLLTACAPAVALKPAPDANDPRCADVTVHLPDTIAGKAKRETNAQATGAWGNPAAVLLRCGVSPIGPTTKPCITVNGIDWVLENDPAASALRYITFGRVPATEVVIGHGKNGVPDASVLPALADAIGQIPQQKQEKCRSTSDITSPSGTPTTTPEPSSTATPAG
ncbi:DUF3515 family protein [Rathayibacter sp. KR2-224]|uniref:DUF3515 family protein n=1 Tax=Rathayibacter sp. KR2-224 TaxID=3400913 RepID=UPI003C0C52DB